jgi:hypothetical protein
VKVRHGTLTPGWLFIIGILLILPVSVTVARRGVSGFLVNTEAEAIAAVAQVGRLDRRRVRAEFERRFSSRRMAEDYLRLYAEVVEQPALSDLCRVNLTSES